MNSFTYNGTSSTQWGLLVTATSVFGAAAPDYENIAIAGRNGELTLFNNRYENIQISYDVAIMDDFKTSAREIAAWLLSDIGYHTLTDTYDSTYYREGRYLGDVGYITYCLYTYGTATITFDCKPQKWLTSGQTSTSYTADTTITNSYAFASKPLIRIYGTGTLTVGDYTVVVNTIVSSYVDVDCETMQCYEGTTNCNSNVEIDEFPQLEPGDNAITLTDITQVDITPRWWVL